MRKLCLLFALGACASAKESEAPAKPAQEIVPGAARLRGGGIRMDVEVGRQFAQRLKGGTVTAKPAAAVVR
jgi:hypothetical protein